MTVKGREPMDALEIWKSISSHLPDANTIAALAGAMSAIAAFRAIRRNDKNHAYAIASAEKARETERLILAARTENERLLNFAVTTLERAYLALRGPDSSASIPPRDRVNWLTSARLIEEYRATKGEIKDPQLYKECESHEEHWRHQFYLLVKPLATGHPDYFSSGSTDETIQSVSAVIVHSFADWPDGKQDPLSAYGSIDAATSRFGIGPRWFNLRNNLRDF
jgi:hypothetical protein